MEHTAALPSDRKFGLLFVVVTAVIAAYLYWKERGGSGYFAAASILLLVISMVRPGLLHLANRAWMAFGLLLNKIVSPLVLGVLFFCVFTPAAYCMRLFGRDVLGLKVKSGVNSYWVVRNPPGPTSQSLREQG